MERFGQGRVEEESLSIQLPAMFIVLSLRSDGAVKSMIFVCANLEYFSLLAGP
jgi:hypothetical protein